VSGDGFVLRVAAHLLAVEAAGHLAELRVVTHILLHADTIAPLPAAEAADAIVRRAAVAVISDVVGQHVVSGISQMLVLDDKVDLDTFVVAPRLAKVSRETGAAHRQSVVEDDELVSLAALGLTSAATSVDAPPCNQDDVERHKFSAVG
jgi:hypothetical protein